MNSYLRERIYNQNPWWKDKKEIEKDSKIVEYNKNPIKFFPSVLNKFDLKKEGIYTLRGPRQVGKSTAIKLLIKKLLEKTAEYSILFYSADDLETPKDIYLLISQYLEIVEELGKTSKFKFIFIDEITSIKNWQKGIKTLYEEGKLKDVFLLVSGSSAIDLRQGAERLPGRRGLDPHPDKILLPLSFREYLTFADFPDYKLLNNLPLFSEILKEPSLSKKLKEIEPIRPQLKRWLAKYEITGGFPRPINDFFSSNRINQATYETYLTWLRGDITKNNRSEHIARQILYEIANLMTSRVEWQSIARKIEIEAHTTVMEYAHLLEDIFATKTIFQIDFHKKRIQPKKRKKIYFLDPLIFWSVLGWNEKWEDFFPRIIEKINSSKPILAESLVAEHLIRKDSYDWTSPSVFFWHNAKEIDFLVFDEKGAINPIEVKYQGRVGDYDFLPLKKSGFKKGLIISQNDFIIKEGFVIIPLEIVLSIM